MVKHILVVGAGSVGKRHVQNLIYLKCSVSIVDTRKDRRDQAKGIFDLMGCYSTLDHALKSCCYDGVIIATPTKYHIDDCLVLIQKKIPVFVEKPLSMDAQEAYIIKREMIKSSFNKVLLGYTYRWWSPLKVFKDWLDTNEIGKPLHARFVMSANLEDWHPWEPYQEFFMAHKELGGGALLDESHFIDLMYDFFGLPDRLVSTVSKKSGLQISSDDEVDVIAQYKSGLNVTIHLDLYGRPHEKYITVVGELGTIKWSFDPNSVQKSKVAEQKWETVLFGQERNDMFIHALQEFLTIIDNDSQPKTCTIDDGCAVMDIIDSIRESSDKGLFVDLNVGGDSHV